MPCTLHKAKVLTFVLKSSKPVGEWVGGGGAESPSVTQHRSILCPRLRRGEGCKSTKVKGGGHSDKGALRATKSEREERRQPHAPGVRQAPTELQPRGQD